jgi:Raf kinase inhibitor-like YbhB/YbcL family protein
MRELGCVVAVASMLLGGCPTELYEPNFDDDSAADDAAADDDGDPGGLLFGSPAFPDTGPIPGEYTCDGENHSPPLSWSGAPAGVASWVVIMVDPDAGDFGHWAIYDIPDEEYRLDEGISPGGALPAGAQELFNSFMQVGYGGCCPPAAHTYEFTLYAIPTVTIGAHDTDTFGQLRTDAQTVALESASFTGVYGG